MTIKTFTFDNGLRLIYEQSISNAHTSYIQAFCDVGSIHEPEGLDGAAHIVEHMCFKGTKVIPDMRKIYSIYDEIGAYVNATTDKHYTKYIIKCNTEFVANMLSIISDMMLHSRFDKKSFRSEEQVVIEENLKSNLVPLEQLYNGTDSMLYEGTNYSKDVDSLSYHKKLFNYSDIIKFYKMFYKPNRMVISIVSKLPFETIKRFVSNTDFAKATNSENVSFPMINNCLTQSTGIKYKIIRASGTYVSVGFRILSEDRYPLICLSMILSGPMSSRLWKILRDDNALSYNANADCTIYDNHGDFLIYADTDSSKIIANGSKPGVLPLIIYLVRDLNTNGVTQKELDVAKGYLYGQMLRDSEDGIEVSHYNGEQSIMFPNQQVVSCSDLYEKFYKNLTKSDIDACIRKYFIKEGMSVCITTNKPIKLTTVKSICE